MDWRHHAACRGADPEQFFAFSPAVSAKAKKVCAACPVRGRCLQHALAAGEDHGVWGGLDEDERRALRNQRCPRDRVA